MAGNGAKWGEIGGDIGHSRRDVGCGGLWWDVVEETGTKMEKMGDNWQKNRKKYPFFTIPCFLLFRGSKTFPTAPFVKISSRTYRRKNGNFCHSPTLTAMAASADAWQWRHEQGSP